MPFTTVLSLKPVQITVRGVGPFQNGQVIRIKFLAAHRQSDDRSENRHYRMDPSQINILGECRPPDAYERSRDLSNLYFLVADGGFGKTSLLDVVHGMFERMAGKPGNTELERMIGDGMAADAFAQFDMRLGCMIDGEHRELIFSSYYSNYGPPIDWSIPMSTDGAVWGAKEWARLGHTAEAPHKPIDEASVARVLAEAMRAARGASMIGLGKGYARPRDGGAAIAMPLPTSLFFGSGDADDAWDEAVDDGTGYRAARRIGYGFDAGLEAALASIGQVQPDRLADILDHLDRTVFLDPARRGRFRLLDRPARLVVAMGGDPPLPVGRLAEGERALLAFHAGALVHAGTGSILLLDEIDRFVPRTAWPAFKRTLGALVGRLGEISIVMSTTNLAFAQSFGRYETHASLAYGGTKIGGWYQ